MAEARYAHNWRARAPYKSQGEEQIARLLERNGIAFQYEYPLAVQDHGKTRLYYPDFRLPEYGLIIEYFGMNGDPGYDARTRHKIGVYKQAGIEGLFLTEESLKGDWPGRVMGRIEDTLKRRLDRFYNRSYSGQQSYGLGVCGVANVNR